MLFISFCTMCALIFQPPSIAQSGFNYVDALAKSILYYEANWCGPDAGENRLWRGPCHVEDGADVGGSVGGFMTQVTM